MSDYSPGLINENSLLSPLATLAEQQTQTTALQSLTPTTFVDVKANVTASSTDTSLVTAQGTGNKIRVVQVIVLCGATATDVTFNTKASGAGTAISPLFACAGNGGFVLPFSSRGWFTTTANEALTCTTGAGSTVGILLKYVVVT